MEDLLTSTLQAGWIGRMQIPDINPLLTFATSKLGPKRPTANFSSRCCLLEESGVAIKTLAWGKKLSWRGAGRMGEG